MTPSRDAAAIFLPLVLGLGCDEPPAPPPPGELTFLRGAIHSPADRGEGTGRRLASGGKLVERSWRPGERVLLDGLSATAPQVPACIPLFTAGLDLSADGLALAFSPAGGEQLAASDHTGRIVVFDGWTGSVLARHPSPAQLPEAQAWARSTAPPEVALTAEGAQLVARRGEERLWRCRAPEGHAGPAVVSEDGRAAVIHAPTAAGRPQPAADLVLTVLR